ncbi:CIC11C00000002402 [Sungouiella intermedia]|uniref:CIC11C00000002402 n=1 Tax=Sungouiella intermedia TaxID=45354 RepID=A0A1L0DGE4_9ASCO|nr:CIC11C00000002402 [[Candida] intermedia]
MTQDEKPHDEDKQKLKNDLPTPEQTQQLEDAVRKLLNPNGENPNMDQYVTNTFNYISNMFNKMQNASDPEAASKEIAEDLKLKFENWAEGQKQKQAQNETGQEAITNEKI